MKIAHRLRQERTLHHKLLRLREMLETGTELAEVSHYFHERLVPDDSFMAAGTCQERPKVMAAVEAVLTKLAPGRAPSQVFAIHLAAERMTHGFLSWGEGVVVFAYFDELQLGFLSYAPQLTDPNVTFARVATSELDSGFVVRTRGEA